MGERGIDIGSTMENLVYLELKRRGYTLHVGKMDDEEVDFIATNSLGRTYIQVTYSLRDSSTEEREIRPLRKINDNHRKVIIVMERSLTTDREGIEEIGLNEFLLGARI